ncbi:family 43 glycosylhydrolase [Candidatus Bathyarchaeota archaeon]|nr:family 43 glycosylhydrolase [Candidatus Bathyarchaeota archaeon]
MKKNPELHIKSIKRYANPIIQSSSNGWDAGALRSPALAKLGSKYYCFYTGQPGPGERGFGQIGVSISSDLENWEKYEGNPCLRPGEIGEWDHYCVADPWVFRYHDRFLMIYETVNPRAFGLAESYDLLHWRKYSKNPILRTTQQWETNGTEPGIMGPCTIEDNEGKWWLYYDAPVWPGPRLMGCATAESPWGPWKKHRDNPILREPFGHNEGSEGGCPFIYEKRVYMFRSVWREDGQMTIRLFTSDDFLHWRICDEPVLEGVYPYETGGVGPNAGIGSPAVCVENERIICVYEAKGREWQIGLMILKI